MIGRIIKKSLAFLVVIMLILSAMPLQVLVSAATVNVLDGQVSITDSATNMSESGGVVTANITGGTFLSKTNTLTITNDSGTKAMIGFDYVASNASSCKIAGVASTSGRYTTSDYIDSGATIKVELTAARKATATLTLSNFTIIKPPTSSNVTFDYDATYGSITVDGAATADGAAIEIPLSGAALVATATNGGSFLGWVNAADGSILSTNPSYTLIPTSDMTVKAVFVGAGSAPHFMIGVLVNESYRHGLLNLVTSYYPTVPVGTHLFDDLNAAAQASASSNASKAIVLLNNSTLPAGDYTIPSGSTLVIPMDSKNTFYTTEPRGREFNNDLDGDGSEQQNDPTKTERYKHTITAYRTLTMASGANIVVNGGFSVPAMHLWAQGATYGGGSPCDSVGMVVMEEGSTITVNNGGALYAYGFITGSGSVAANSGAKVYEYFQIPDFRGGTQSTDMQNGVFPLSQYYVQNIEVPLKLNSGAQEYSYTTLYMSKQDVSSSVAFIGSSNSMFNLTSGYVIKKYDSSTDRLIIELNGNMTVSPVSMKLGTNTLDSDEYELPINNNITVSVLSGSNIVMGQDIAMLPGSEIIINEGANCTLKSGINIYIYDLDQWGNYAGATNEKFIPVVNIAPVPGRVKYTRTVADLCDAKIQVDGYIDASQGFVYTTSSGANVCSTGTGVANVKKGSETVTYALLQGTGYIEIPIKPVWFKNADGTYLQSVTDTYTYTDGKWNCTAHSYEVEVTDPTCTDQGHTTHTCAACGDTFIDTYTDATGHTFGDWIVSTDPTCENPGSKYRQCATCSHKEVEAVETLDHDYEEAVTAPTCTEPGYTTYTCTVCGYYYKDNYTDPAHNYTSEEFAPTCTEQGYTKYTCSACGDSYEDNYVDANGHDYADAWTVDVEATDLNEGSKSRHCANCDSITDVTVIPAKTDFIVEIIEDTVKIIGYKGTINGALQIPISLDSYNVTEIAASAFSGFENIGFVVFEGTIAQWNSLTVDSKEVLSATIVYLGEKVGDVNADNVINADDLVAMTQIILKNPELDYTATYIADTTGDGTVNILDLVRLKKHFANSKVVLGIDYSSALATINAPETLSLEERKEW